MAVFMIVIILFSFVSTVPKFRIIQFREVDEKIASSLKVNKNC